MLSKELIEQIKSDDVQYAMDKQKRRAYWDNDEIDLEMLEDAYKVKRSQNDRKRAINESKNLDDFPLFESNFKELIHEEQKVFAENPDLKEYDSLRYQRAADAVRRHFMAEHIRKREAAK